MQIIRALWANGIVVAITDEPCVAASVGFVSLKIRDEFLHR